MTLLSTSLAYNTAYNVTAKATLNSFSEATSSQN